MKITDLIVESQQIDELTAADVGQGIGKAAGAVGAVAGGVKGAWQAAKKGFEKGRATVAGETPPRTAGAASAQGSEDPASIQQQIKQKETEIQALQGKLKTAKQAAAQAASAPDAAPPPATAPAAATAPATPDAATQARIDAAPQGYDPETGKPIAAPAPQSAAPAPAATQTAEPAAPAADGKLTAQQQAAKKAEILGRRAAGNSAGTTQSKFGNYVKNASGQRIVGANKDGSVRTVDIKASKINTGNNLSESLAQKIEQHKRKMFETGLAQGTTSIFRK